MAALTDPGLPGSFAFDTVIYASAGSNYGGVPALSQYTIYDTPDPAYVTPRVNISVFANLGIGAPWPFPNTSVPLNGHVCIPRGRGPFPLAVFAHGNHDPLSNSTPGYLYLCSLLASQGIVAATIDVNFLNGGNFGENDARGIVHLEHVKQFRTWNSTATHPLHGKIELNRILIVGHSRGGEGVGHASFFNPLPAIKPDIFSPTVPLDGSAGLGPYRFALRCIAAIAPTDRQYTPITGPTVVPDRYFLIHGSRDGDVSTFEGYNTFNRAHAVDLANPTVSDGKLKALLWVLGANHNQFNSTWPTETPPATTMPRADQEQVAKVALGALAQALLLDRVEYMDVLRDHANRRRLDARGRHVCVAIPGSGTRLSTARAGSRCAATGLPAGTGNGRGRRRDRDARAEGSCELVRTNHDDHPAPRMERARGAPALAGFTRDVAGGAVQGARAARGTIDRA
jgi:hypothetical protein